ncbi:transporter substrate-binding domain-containing protein [Agrobacterium vitis]|uniref:Transporter substrate-binding domain-containing protein n=1 Tax=Agrobacterium vitis TaxID=373 RepID=A0A6L6VHR1_AGRVI|nr:transporter substrate-binding domain-containing protein [Agrobacterium vitis]
MCCHRYSTMPSWLGRRGISKGWRCFGQRIYGPQISGGVFGPGVGIGLRTQDNELTGQLNAAIKSLKVDGTLKALSLKWFGTDLVSE